MKSLSLVTAAAVLALAGCGTQTSTDVVSVNPETGTTTTVRSYSYVSGGSNSSSLTSRIERDAQYASLNLTPDEQNIWETLDETQKARALEFIRNGGTLIASLGDK